MNLNLPPLLPALLPEVLENVPDDALKQQLVGQLVANYESVFASLKGHRSFWLPDLYLQFARGLAFLPDKSWARKQFKASVEAWLAARALPTNVELLLEAIELMQREGDDEEYLKALRECAGEIFGEQLVEPIDRILRRVERKLVS